MRCFLIFVVLVLINFEGFSQIKKYIRKASKAIENNNNELARDYFLKAYNLDNNNYKSNLGLGVVLSEFMGKHEEALPHLIKAYSTSPKDTSIDGVYALVKSYQHVGEYEKCLEILKVLQGTFAI